MKDPRDLSPAEFEIAKILWHAGEPLSVAGVLEPLRRHKKVAYTTVMTQLDKMAQKGSLRRSKKGKAYLYAPRVDREEVLNFLIRVFEQNYLAGDEDGIWERASKRTNEQTSKRENEQTSKRTNEQTTVTKPAAAEIEDFLL